MWISVNCQFSFLYRQLIEIYVLCAIIFSLLIYVLCRHAYFKQICETNLSVSFSLCSQLTNLLILFKYTPVNILTE